MKLIILYHIISSDGPDTHLWHKESMIYKLLNEDSHLFSLDNYSTSETINYLKKLDLQDIQIHLIINCEYSEGNLDNAGTLFRWLSKHKNVIKSFIIYGYHKKVDSFLNAFDKKKFTYISSFEKLEEFINDI